VRLSLIRLALAAALAAACACGPTGPDTHTGLSACDQLRECMECVGDSGALPPSCNIIDLLESNADAQRLCTQQLQFQGCGRPLQVNPPGF
jgi:hypothetical protein